MNEWMNVYRQCVASCNIIVNGMIVMSDSCRTANVIDIRVYVQQ